MTTRIAATLALVVFAVCVIAGMTAENGFTTVIVRALLAMLVTLIVGLVIGAMAQRMLDENLASQKIAGKPEDQEAGPAADGR
jgi:NhaP-type Na+/H+ or K+/H+ antiporter